MQTYISLLRGINVSGSKKIKMVELKALYEKLKFKEVHTFIQSGNVIFKSTKLETAIIQSIYDGLKKEWNYDVTIIIKTPNQLRKILDGNPFLENRAEDIKKLYVTFLEEAPPRKLINEIKDFKPNNEEFVFKGKEIFIFYPENMGTSKIQNNYFERKLNVGATTRNWNSLNRMYSKAIEVEAM